MKKNLIYFFLIVMIGYLYAFEVKLESFFENKNSNYLLGDGVLFDSNACLVTLLSDTGYDNQPLIVDFEQKKYVSIDKNIYLQGKKDCYFRKMYPSRKYGIVFFLIKKNENRRNNYIEADYYIEYDILNDLVKEVTKEYFRSQFLIIPSLGDFDYIIDLSSDLSLIKFMDEETEMINQDEQLGVVKLGLINQWPVRQKLNTKNSSISDFFDFTSDLGNLKKELKCIFFDEKGSQLLLMFEYITVNISPKLNYIMLITNYTIEEKDIQFDHRRTYIYHITYDGVVNDDLVRLRSEPNLQSQTLGHVNIGDKIKIIDLSYEKQKIDAMNAYWYKVELPDGKTGWVYGAYVDVE